MTPDNPNGTGDESFASIEDAADTWQDDEHEDQAQPDNQTPPEGQMPESEETDDDELTDIDGQPEGDEEPGPDVATGGRFAADDAKVKLPDGTWTTVGDLRNGSMMLTDYRRKTAEHAESVRGFEAEKTRVQSLATELQQQREVVAFFADAMLPKRPDPKLIEEGNIVEYNLAEAVYVRQMEALGQLKAGYQAHLDRQAADQERRRSQTVAENRQKLAERAPHLATREGYAKFWNEAVKAGEHYGWTAEELAQLTDHRHYLVIEDALKYRRIKAKSKQKPQGEQRPVLTGSTRRPGNAQQQQRDEARARFNKKPTIHNALDLID